jgi:hypothetical protein
MLAPADCCTYDGRERERVVLPGRRPLWYSAKGHGKHQRHVEDVHMSSDEPGADQDSEEDRERRRDAAWALRDPDVQRRYGGEWLVAYRRQVIAHGPDPDAVVEEANRLIPGYNHLLVCCPYHDPDAWLDLP